MVTTEKQKLKSLAMIGAFISSGISENGLSTVINSKPESLGFLELIDDACQYAELAHNLLQTGYEFCDECPGVFAYEVIEPFGAWYGKYVIENNDVPPGDQSRKFLVEESKKFFCQIPGLNYEKLEELLEQEVSIG